MPNKIPLSAHRFKSLMLTVLLKTLVKCTSLHSFVRHTLTNEELACESYTTKFLRFNS